MRKYFLSSAIFLMLTGLTPLFAEIKIGAEALDFSLPTLDESKVKVKMASYKNTNVLLNFWASWCKGCKKEMPFLHKLAKDKGDKLSVVAVNIDNKAKKAETYINKFKSKMGETSKIIFVHDKKKLLPKAYELEAVPCSLLIKNGKIVQYYLGSFDEESEEVLLSDLKKVLR